MPPKAPEVQTSLVPSELSRLATEINSHHSQAVRQATSALEHARQAGELLSQAKSLTAHGQWLPWLSANCKVSPRQAQRYMQVATNWETITKNDATSHLTIDGAIATVSNQSNSQDFVSRLDALPSGRMFYASLHRGYVTIFRSKRQPEHFHCYMYLFGSSDAGEAQETQKPATATGIAWLLDSIQADTSKFVEVNQVDGLELNPAPTQGYLPWSNAFWQMMEAGE